MATNSETTKSKGFTKDEQQAMKDRARELRDEARISKNRAAGEGAALDAIKALSEPDKTLAKQIHELVTKTAPELFPKTWYGMPAYANKDGKVICFFQAAQKFEARYATLGFSDTSKLDEGNMWPTAFGLKQITSAEEKKIIELVKKAVG
jgi:uncharacterized protein YdhG (YjbR/CyaY superfamily)